MFIMYRTERRADPPAGAVLWSETTNVRGAKRRLACRADRRYGTGTPLGMFLITGSPCQLGSEPLKGEGHPRRL